MGASSDCIRRKFIAIDACDEECESPSQSTDYSCRAAIEALRAVRARGTFLQGLPKPARTTSRPRSAGAAVHHKVTCAGTRRSPEKASELMHWRTP
jgi:hypothetical protein